MRYHIFQSGVRDGPLYSHFIGNDLLRPLSNEARGGGYEARYIAKLLDGIVSKCYQFIYPLTGPFLGEPFNVALLLVTALFLVLAVNEWFSSLPAALVAGGAWLLTSQTLLDSRYPIRPNMMLANALAAYILWELLCLRRKERSGGWPLVRMSLAFLAALMSQECSFFILLPMLVIVVFQRRRYRNHYISLGAGMIGTVVIYAVFFCYIYPTLMRRFIGEEPLIMWMGDNSPLELLHPRVFFQRLKEFTLSGIWFYFRRNWGLSQVVPRWEWMVSGVGLIFLGVSLFKYWRMALGPLAGALLLYLAISLVMFPYVPASVEMPVYYYALVVMWFIFPMAALLAGLSRSGRKRWWAVALIGLALIAAVNVHDSAMVADEMPGDFGFTDKMREYVGDILKLGTFLRSGRVPQPLYTAYPRPRRFDISIKWDLMLRVWHGEAERVFSMMLPVLYLKDFEARRLLGNQEEFFVTAELHSGAYELAACAFADMPRRGWYDLLPLRSDAVSPETPPVWQSKGKEQVTGVLDETLMGRTFRSIIPAGTWKTLLSFPVKLPAPSIMALLSRADLQTSGLDEVWYRTSPLPEYSCSVALTTAIDHVRLPHTYGWSYQLQLFPLDGSGTTREVSLEVVSGGNTEIIGPVMVPPGAVRFYPWPVVGGESGGVQ